MEAAPPVDRSLCSCAGSVARRICELARLPILYINDIVVGHGLRMCAPQLSNERLRIQAASLGIPGW